MSSILFHSVSYKSIVTIGWAGQLAPPISFYILRYIMLKRAIDCKGNIIGHDITAIKGREQKFDVVDGIAFEKPIVVVPKKAEPKKVVEEVKSTETASLEDLQNQYLVRF